MARLVTEKSGVVTMVRLLIDHSVGLHGRNRRDDVQLIQLMLNAANNYLHGFFDVPVPEELNVDGICGEKTLAAIRAYQENVNKVWPNTLAEYGTVNATRKTE